jgi:LysM repeat protein
LPEFSENAANSRTTSATKLAASHPAVGARDSAARPAEKIEKGEKQNLVVPRTSVKASTVQAVVHRVKPGETLYSIARNYQTTVEALRNANRFLLNRSLEAGDTLRIPATPKRLHFLYLLRKQSYFLPFPALRHGPMPCLLAANFLPATGSP